MNKTKIFITLITVLSGGYALACSTCNTEFTEEEKRAYILATILLLVIPFTIGYMVYRFVFKKYK
jgi:hypothetical protein